MAKKEHDFTDPEGFYTTSLRIPNALGKQIVERARLQKRSVNAEVALLLERQIESQVEKDRLIVEKMHEFSLQDQRSNPS